MLVLSLALAFAAAADTAHVVPNENHAAAGRLRSGVLTVRLEAREGLWYPEGEHGPGLPIAAFAEEGKAPSAPGPLIRVRSGTEVRVTVRNTLAETLWVFGLEDRPAQRADSVEVLPGTAREIAFRATAPGTYFYRATTMSRGYGEGDQLAGALVVDPPGGAASDRILLITLWEETETAARAAGHPQRETLLVNGLAWPYTERLAYTVGDSVRWRVINASPAPHPMHLHGFYFRVNSRGTAERDTVYTAEQQRLAVTEFMRAFTTMALTWVPERAGNWLFHCHLIAHISPELRLGAAEPGHGGAGAMRGHAMAGMAGLVMGIQIRPRSGSAPPELAAVPRRSLRMYVNQRANVFQGAPGYSFILQEGATPPAPDSLRIPGTPVVLTRGEPVEITVVNRSREQVTVHWHGIELESYYDGVGDWSGYGTRTAPPIAPGDSFVVRMTPDRAGTFIYHTHNDESGQLSSGLYGPLIVVEPGQPLDTTLERILLLGAGGPRRDAPPLLNGSAAPPPLELAAGRTYRLRLINIAPSSPKQVRLRADTTVQEWRAFAKDGAYLPAWQRTVQPGLLRLGPGETYDFEFTPAQPRDYVLEVTTFVRGLPPNVMRAPLRVR